MNSKPTNNHSRLNALAAQANDSLAPRARYTTTPTTRNGDGFHRTEKPTSGDGQWVLVPGGKLPPRGFELHPKERQRFHLLARTLPLEGNPMGADTGRKAAIGLISRSAVFPDLSPSEPHFSS